MSVSPSAQQTVVVSDADASDARHLAPSEIDASCRLPVMVLFVASVAWLIAGLTLGVISSIKLHGAGFLAECPWLTYGRVRPASVDILVYGFASQAGLAAALWMFARLARNVLQGPVFIALGSLFWNVGVAIGVAGILAGDTTGYELLEFPRYATPMLFFSFALIAIWAVLTFHTRREAGLYPSQWYVLGALLWFPWVYTTAQILLVFSPVRGVLQAVISGWAAHNLYSLWLTPLGLAVGFYFLPKISNRPLYSRSLAVFGFWLLALFGAFGGVAVATPVPTWISGLSVVGTVCSSVAVLAVATNWYLTLTGAYGRWKTDAIFRFILFGSAAGILAGLLRSIGALRSVSESVEFTLFTPGVNQLHLLGFLGMMLIGALYYVVPRVSGAEWPSQSLVKVHFRFASIGVVLLTLPLMVGGVVQGSALNKSAVNFLDVVRSTIPFLGMSTLGGLLLLVGAVLLGVNICRLIGTTCCKCCGSGGVNLAKSHGRKS
jgi:cytochrome c oxidase cbb3-type subunit 1